MEIVKKYKTPLFLALGVSFLYFTYEKMIILAGVKVSQILRKNTKRKRPVRIILVRHGESEANLNSMLYS